MKIIILFIILQFINVLLQTVKSVLTVKGSRLVAAISNAVAYGVYMFVIIYTVADFNIWVKVAVTMVTNFFGVYISKFILDKFRKDRLWQIIATIKEADAGDFEIQLDENELSYNAFIGAKIHGVPYTEFHIFSRNQKESHLAKELMKQYDCKYTVQEEQVRL